MIHHHHDHDHDHDNDFDFGEDAIVEDIEGIEMFRLRSVGIDIGSSTSHLVFSLLTLRREGAAYSSQFKVTDRQVLYRSPIMLTPYLSGVLIDTEQVREFVQESYREAGFTPEEVDTGAVIITGEALKKENARPITEMFARESGKFICASAGPNHEALLAAYGCGAVALSRDEAATVLNIDMGGGTTKLSLIRRGEVISSAAISVGARLIAFDPAGVVTRLEDPARPMLHYLGAGLSLGATISEEVKDAFSALMARLLFEVVEGDTLSPLAAELLLTESLRDYRGSGEVDFVVFSGGVSEYVYGHEKTGFGDLGLPFSQHINRRLAQVFRDGVLREAAEGIRATVIGAGEYTVQASGTTSHLSGVGVLPVFGLKVVRPALDEGGSVAESLELALAKFDLTGFVPGLALALAINGDLNYRNLRSLAEGVARVAGKAESEDGPLFLVLDQDVAKSLGGILKEEFLADREVIVVDGIDVGDLDYLDIGLPLGVTEVVPVTVKSLVFPTTT